ncbi:MAG: YXWGXW repeat-containing protein [Chloroflexi bacterium]|nr:YXWGXW repeat-containing protein [Chloroflexota bacterium]
MAQGYVWIPGCWSPPPTDFSPQPRTHPSTLAGAPP